MFNINNDIMLFLFVYIGTIKELIITLAAIGCLSLM